MAVVRLLHAVQVAEACAYSVSLSVAPQPQPAGGDAGGDVAGGGTTREQQHKAALAAGELATGALMVLQRLLSHAGWFFAALGGWASYNRM